MRNAALTYHVQEGEMRYGPRLLGPSHLIYVDGNQDIAKAGRATEQFKVVGLPVGDYVFQLMGEGGLIVGIEEKKLPDLVTSFKTRRLQRQLRQLTKAVSIPVLAFRLTCDRYYMLDPYRHNDTVQPLLSLLKWQAVGGMVAVLPGQYKLLCDMLLAMQSTLKPGRGMWSVLAGEDKPQSAKVGPLASSLHRLIPGIGPAMGSKLESHYGGLLAALTAPDEEWQALGIPKHILSRRKEVLDDGQPNPQAR